MRPNSLLTRPVLYAFTLLALSLAAPDVRGDEPPAGDLAVGDAEFGKHNYKRALGEYEAWLAGQEDRSTRQAVDIALKTMRCHYALSQYDESLAALKGILAEPALDPLLRAHVENALGELYFQLPGEAYRRDDGELHYNPGNYEGEYVWRWYENNRDAFVHLERAKLIVDGAWRDFVAGTYTTDEDLRERVIEANFALAERYQTTDTWDYELSGADGHPGDDLPAGATFDPRWTVWHRVMFLYDEIVATDAGRKELPENASHHSAQALYRQALFLESMPEPNASTPEQQRPQAELPEIEYTDEQRDPLAVLDRILAEFGGGTQEDLVVYTHAHVRITRGEYALAEAELKAFLSRFPTSAWVGDVKNDLQEMRYPQLSVSSVNVIAPGGGTTIPISSRNIDGADFTAHKVDLLAVLSNGARLRNPNVSFDDFQRNFGNIDGVRKHYLERAAAWHQAIDDQGDHQYVYTDSELPLTEPGAYIVEATAAKHDAAFLVIVSDVTVILRQDEDSVLAFVADALTGEPLPSFPLIFKETYYDYSRRGRYKVELVKDYTDEDGVARYPLMTGDVSSNTVAVLAAEGDHLAVTPALWGGGAYYGDAYDQYKVFCTTDRPVYRPEQTVHFKHIVRAVRSGETVNVPDTAVKVTISDPQGDTVYDELLTTSEFGTVHGEFTLGEEPPLGVYYTYIEVAQNDLGAYPSAGAQFRVEEYRKPEFEVKVDAAELEARPGAEIPVDIRAVYYFGAPVADAKVSYTVYRTPYHHSFARPGAYDWLFGPGYGVVHERPYDYYGEELVEEGELTTDADGVAKLTLSPPQSEDYDYSYSIQVEVTDLARRTIHGAGNVTVTRQPFFADVYAPRGFYSPGDTVELEVQAQTPGGAPVPAEGTLSTYSVTWDEETDEEVLALLHEELFVLDEHGQRFTEFTPDQAGNYRLVFKAPAGEGLGDVEASRDLWVYDETFPGMRLRFANLELITDKRHYEKGDTLRLMVQSPFVDPTVLLSFDGAAEVIDHQVLRIDGRSEVVEVVLDDAHVPNFFVRAAMAHDYQVFTRDREIFVPPTDRFIQVAVEGDAPDFRPGQESTFTVTAKDHLGQPVQGEFSLGVVDKSVYYIQAETAGDIRAYYYGDRRFSSYSIDHSRSFYSYQLSRDRNRREEYSITGIPYFWGLSGMGYYGFGWGGGGGVALDGLMMREEVSAEAKAAPAKAKRGRSSGSAGGIVGGVLGGTVDTRTVSYDFEDDMIEGDLMKPAASTPMDPSPGPQVELRTEFKDTAHWEPVVVTDAQGRATVTLTWPDTLTTWDVVVRGIDKDSRVGGARMDALTTKELLVRLEAPRFMVEQDRLVISAVVNNRGAEARQASVTLAVPAELIRADGELVQTVEVPAGGQTRLDFPVEVLRAGDAVFTATAVADDEGDAVQLSYPVLTWGAEKMVTESTVLRDGGAETLAYDVPAQRRADTTVLTVQLNPSLASVMLDAVPYLIDYPYGCVEQTMSRFMPAALTAKTLEDLGVDFADIRKLSKQDGLLGEETEHLGYYDKHPVFFPGKLDRVITKSLSRLYAFQHIDGGWGWWKAGDSDAYMTAYVVMGMQTAVDAGHAVDPVSLSRGYNHIKRKYHKDGKQEDVDLWMGHRRVYMAYVLSLRDGLIKAEEMDGLFATRDNLSNYGKSLLALALHNVGDAERAALVVDNLRDLARVDADNGTASFDYDDASGWWYWYNDRVETNAWALRAFLAIAPDDELNDMFMKWLVNNRRGGRWNSTKDTAQAVMALADYLKVRDELNPDYGLTVRLNGEELLETRVTRKNMFTMETQLTVTGDAIRSGENTVEVLTAGKGALYATGYLTYFTKEKKIKGSGNEIFIDREYFKLTPKVGQRESGRGTIDVRDYDRQKLRDGATVDSGELVQVKVTVKALNRYEYLIFEDYKPAGFEPEALKSGYLYDNGTWFNMELRDEKVAFFLDRIRQGNQVLDYVLRAETPGTFRVLPHNGYAMYAPRVRAISDSYELKVVDGN